MIIEEGNKLIAEFMGWRYISDGDVMFLNQNTPAKPINRLQFHSSWDWLMPVLEKIVQENDDVIIDICVGDDTTFYNKDRTGGSVFRQTGTLDNTWRACVYFIQKQNENSSSLQS
jgi:hypothetical protein